MIRTAVVTLLALVAAGGLAAAPAPFDKPDREDRIVLRLAPKSRVLKDVSELEVTLTLTNLGRRSRSLVKLPSFSGTLEGCQHYYVYRFPDGNVLAWRRPIVDPIEYRLPPNATCFPLKLTAGGRVSAVVELWYYASTPRFTRLLKNNDGRFCLTAVLPCYGLQSNSVLYNDCAPPPRTFSALDEINRWRAE